METSIGHSIWLMPSGTIRDELIRVITLLADQYATPLFSPHMTLLGELTGTSEALESRTQQVASKLRAFEITLTTLDYLDEYFRCLFVRAEETPALLEANRIARIIFHREQDSKFMPHLSLMYGDFRDLQKQRIIIEIGSHLDLSFQVSGLYLVSTRGEPRQWRTVKEFPVK